jgi:ABC-type uncharacterized transport system substrate-binding protein
MKLFKIFIAVSMVLGMSIYSSIALAAEKGNIATAPKKNGDKKWKIAYYEGGEYIDYKGELVSTIKGLMDIGWIQASEVPEDQGESTKITWDWLSTKATSNYLEFLKDGHYSAEWDDNIRKKMAANIIERLNKKNEIDLIIAMGTWAGKDLANNNHKVPTIVLTASDAVSSGIIKSVEDSGYDHVNAHVDPMRYERQIRIFHDIFKFKNLGVAYEDTVEGRSYASLDLIEKASKDLNFNIVRCQTKSDIADKEAAGESVIKCFEIISKKADGIYVTLQGGVNTKTIPKLVQIANANKIPTFSQSGSDEVKEGFLLSQSHSGFKYVGMFHAQTMAKIFNGGSPRQLTQVFEGPPKIAINLKTAEVIGFNPPMILLGAADEIYESIGSAN